MANPYMGIPTLALSATAVVPSDTVGIATTKSLFVGVAGDVTVIHGEDEASVTYVNVIGFLPIMVKQVLDTGTDATNILALY